MKRTIKSSADIEKEISAIIDNNSDDKILSDEFFKYLNNLTGKELPNKLEIISIIIRIIIEKDRSRFESILKNPDLFLEMFPVLKLFLLHKDLKRVYSHFSLASPLYSFTDEMIVVNDEYKKYLNSEQDSDVIKKNILKNENTYKKLHDFLSKNNDVEKLLLSFLFQAKQKLIIKLIIDKIIPLQAILIYFDTDLSVKQNTESIYKLLDKKVTRQKIQSVITDNLNRIREGKYSVPIEHTYDESTFREIISSCLPKRRNNKSFIDLLLKK